MNYGKTKTLAIVSENPGLFLGCNVYNFRVLMDLSSLTFHVVNPIQLEASHEECDAIVRKDCNDFLKTHKGLSYLRMKYPNLLVSQAVNEYVKNALWIDSIV